MHCLREYGPHWHGEELRLIDTLLHPVRDISLSLKAIYVAGQSTGNGAACRHGCRRAKGQFNSLLLKRLLPTMPLCSVLGCHIPGDADDRPRGRDRIMRRIVGLKWCDDASPLAVAQQVRQELRDAGARSPPRGPLLHSRQVFISEKLRS